MDFDLIVVGAGHNALVAAAYVAQAGYRVAVFEKRPIVGGAVSTVECVPGYKFDLGGSAHILIRLTPIVEELRLDRFGLEYLECDPLFFAPFEDGDAVFIHRSVDKTCEGLERTFPGQGEAYRRFIADWKPFSETVREAFLHAPSPFELGKTFALGPSAKMDWQRALGTILKPYGEVVDEYFNEEKIKAPLVWMAAQSGPPPTEPLTAPFLLWHPLYHESGVARPRGGSGGLTVALRAHIEAHGGSVFTDAGVDEIVVENSRATGVRIGQDVSTARAVLSGTHIVETIERLLAPAHRPPASRSFRTGNGFGAVLRLALNRPVRYAAHPGPDARIALQLICESRQQILNAYAEYLQGKPASRPPIVGMTFSAIDDTLAPPGGEVLWLWAQYFPYEMTEGRSWDEIGDEVAESILDSFEPYAPGTKASVVGHLFQHPLWLERELGLRRGNVMHLEMSLDQMFALRPAIGLSEYRSHLDGLYLTGASTHPGGGIMGASGRSAARVVLRDLDSRPLWSVRR